VDFIRHGTLDQLTMNELRVMLERHAQVFVRPDLGLGGHLSEE
jgi:hypothetical protein